MDYAIIEIGGSQQRVSPGDVIKVEKLPAEQAPEGGTLKIDRVLMIRKDKGVTVGSPLVEGASVKATVVGSGKSKKIIVFKKKRRKQYRRTRGHRQAYSTLRIEDISSGG